MRAEAGAHNVSQIIRETSLVFYDETKPFTVLRRQNEFSAAGRTHTCRRISLELQQIAVVEHFFCFQIDRLPAVTRNVHGPTHWLDSSAFVHGKHERANHGVAELHRLTRSGLLSRLRFDSLDGPRSTSRRLSGAGGYCPAQDIQDHQRSQVATHLIATVEWPPA